MAVTFGFYNSLEGDRKYDATQMSAIFNGIILDGVFQTIGTQLKVLATTGRTITVGIGRAWFNGTWTWNDADLPLTVDQAEPVLARIDSVVLEVDKTEAVRANSIKIIKGTPSSTPQPPVLINDGVEIFQHKMADIRVNPATTDVVQADITNYIGTSTFPYVTGPLTTFNNDKQLIQWEDQFNKWFDSVRGMMAGDPITNIVEEIQVMKETYYGENILMNAIWSVYPPINQRVTIPTGSTLSYSIDRWYRGGVSLNIETTTNGIILSSNPNTGPALRQYLFDQSLIGKPLTLSLKAEGVVSSSSGIIPIGTTTGIFLITPTVQNSEGQIVQVRARLAVSNQGVQCELYLSFVENNPRPILVEYVKLEFGSIPTPAIPRPFAQELALCQRYYEKSYNYATIPGSPINVGVAVSKKKFPSSASTIEGFLYNVEKRTTPSIKIYSRRGTLNRVSNWSAVSSPDYAVDVTGSSNAGTKGIMGLNFAAPVDETLEYAYHWEADAEIY